MSQPVGRPEIGNNVQIRLGDLFWDVEQFREQNRVKSRAQAVRDLVRAGLAARPARGGRVMDDDNTSMYQAYCDIDGMSVSPVSGVCSWCSHQHTPVHCTECRGGTVINFFCTVCGADYWPRPRTLINLTPHVIRVYPEDTPDRLEDGQDIQPVLTVPPADQPVQLSERIQSTLLHTGGVPVVDVEFGHEVYLPSPAEGAWYIVSLPTALAMARAEGRRDVLVPYREVRGHTGSVVGCRALARPA